MAPAERFGKPLAVAAIDADADGQADFLFVGVDENRDGIPDALQASGCPVKMHQIGTARVKGGLAQVLRSEKSTPSKPSSMTLPVASDRAVSPLRPPGASLTISPGPSRFTSTSNRAVPSSTPRAASLTAPAGVVSNRAMPSSTPRAASLTVPPGASRVVSNRTVSPLRSHASMPSAPSTVASSPGLLHSPVSKSMPSAPSTVTSSPGLLHSPVSRVFSSQTQGAGGSLKVSPGRMLSPRPKVYSVPLSQTSTRATSPSRAGYRTEASAPLLSPSQISPRAASPSRAGYRAEAATTLTPRSRFTPARSTSAPNARSRTWITQAVDRLRNSPRAQVHASASSFSTSVVAPVLPKAVAAPSSPRLGKSSSAATVQRASVLSSTITPPSNGLTAVSSSSTLPASVVSSPLGVLMPPTLEDIDRRIQSAADKWRMRMNGDRDEAKVDKQLQSVAARAYILDLEDKLKTERAKAKILTMESIEMRAVLDKQNGQLVDQLRCIEELRASSSKEAAASPQDITSEYEKTIADLRDDAAMYLKRIYQLERAVMDKEAESVRDQSEREPAAEVGGMQSQKPNASDSAYLQRISELEREVLSNAIDVQKNESHQSALLLRITELETEVEAKEIEARKSERDQSALRLRIVELEKEVEAKEIEVHEGGREQSALRLRIAELEGEVEAKEIAHVSDLNEWHTMDSHRNMMLEQADARIQALAQELALREEADTRIQERAQELAASQRPSKTSSSSARLSRSSLSNGDAVDKSALARRATGDPFTSSGSIKKVAFSADAQFASGDQEDLPTTSCYCGEVKILWGHAECAHRLKDFSNDCQQRMKWVEEDKGGRPFQSGAVDVTLMWNDIRDFENEHKTKWYRLRRPEKEKYGCFEFCVAECCSTMMCATQQLFEDKILWTPTDYSNQSDIKVKPPWAFLFTADAAPDYLQKIRRPAEIAEFEGTEPPDIVKAFIEKFQSFHASCPPLKGKRIQYWKPHEHDIVTLNKPEGLVRCDVAESRYEVDCTPSDYSSLRDHYACLQDDGFG